jgi:DnaK suppressor protein
MEAKQLAFFKDLLLVQRTEILNKAYGPFLHGHVESTGKGDEGDLAATELNVSLSFRLQERQTQMLQMIDRALSKLDSGSFGLCEQCDESLNFNRLKARPVANLCVACKEEQEKRGRAYA